MNEAAEKYFNDCKAMWSLNAHGLLVLFLCVPLYFSFFFTFWASIFAFLSILSMFWFFSYILYMRIVFETYSKKRQYYHLKKQNIINDYTDELEKFFTDKNNYTFLFPWQFFQTILKKIYVEIFYGEMAPASFHILKLDLLQEIIIKIWGRKKEEKQKFEFSLLPYEIQTRFIELQTPYEKYKFLHAFPRNSIFEKTKPFLIVDNLEVHFDQNANFYSKWFFLRLLDRRRNRSSSRSNTSNLIIDMPWHSIQNIFKYFFITFNDKFVLTFTATNAEHDKKYANFLPKIIPINSIILSGLPSDSFFTTLKLCNIFSMKKLEIVDSRLSAADLKYLKIFKLQSLLLHLSFCESYNTINTIFKVVQGIPDIRIDITFSFYLKGFFEESAVKWVKKYGYPTKFVFIIRILNEFHVKFL